MIDREKAISVLKKMPICVECDASVATFTCCECENAFVAAIEALKQPDIVRCKDCISGEIKTLSWNGQQCVECHAHEEIGYDHEPDHPLDWFCADGKRKEEHDDQSI